MTSRGMMAENMFNGKGVILGWLNSSFALKLEKIEDTCTGAVACQIIDYLHPGSINMKKVDFNVKNAYEFVGNYKELQQAFNRNNIDRAFNVQALSKGKLQDNNEFMQFLKGYWDERTGGQAMSDYEAVARRCASKTGDWRRFSCGAAGGGAGVVGCAGHGADGGSRGSLAAATIPALRRPGAARPSSGQAARRTPAAGAGPEDKSALAEAQAQVESQAAELGEATQRLETAERERDFYFSKLRTIEILCQTENIERGPAIECVEKILYAADDEAGASALADAQAALALGALSVDAEVAASVVSKVDLAQQQVPELALGA